MYRLPGPTRSGALDSMVVAHGWGHYFHRRLQPCRTAMCTAQSEGWSDFVTLHTAVEDGDDDANGVYRAVIYSTATFGAKASAFGIRRFP